MSLLRYLWVSPATLVGLLVAAIALLGGGRAIIGRDDAVLERARSHEQVHVRQYERWGGFFFPAYPGSSLLQLARGRDPYRDNCFEVEAFAGEARQ